MPRPLPVLLLALAACAPDAALDTSLDGAVDQASPPGQPVLWSTSVVPGDAVDFVVEDASPGDTIRIYASTRGRGAGPCPAAYSPACLSVQSPVALATVTADPSGRADHTLVVPGSLPGDTVWLQALGTGNGRAWSTPVIRRKVHDDPPAPLMGLTRPPEEAFTLGRIGIQGDTLFTEVSYGGGCADHEFIAMWPGAITADATFIDILQRPSGDFCDAWITEILTWDLDPIRAAAPTGSVEITVEGQPISFDFPLP